MHEKKALVSKAALNRLEAALNKRGGDPHLFCTGGALANAPLHTDHDWKVLRAAYIIESTGE